MTQNELELINIIRNSNNPNQAVITATKIILDYLKQLGSSQEQASVVLQEHV